MSDRDYQKIAQIIGGLDSKISTLAKKSKIIKNLNDTLVQSLPKHLANQVTAYDIYQGILKLSVPNASIATQIRNLSSSIVTRLNNSFSSQYILSLQCKITSTSKAQESSTNIPRASCISNASRAKLNWLSTQIKDPKLASAVKKLGGKPG